MLASSHFLLELSRDDEESFSLHAYNINRDNPELQKRATFMLPLISERRTHDVVNIQFLPNSSADRTPNWSAPRGQGSFHISPNQIRLAALRISITGGGLYTTTDYLFFSLDLLVKAIPLHASVSNPARVPWKDWGEPGARFIEGVRVLPGKHIYGWNVILRDVVLSFCQEEIARDLARGSSKAIVTPTVIPKDRPFATEVATNLPYFETSYRLVGVEDNFEPGRVQFDERVLFEMVRVVDFHSQLLMVTFVRRVVRLELRHSSTRARIVIATPHKPRIPQAQSLIARLCRIPRFTVDI